MTQATTAAEALKKSKSGIVQSIYADYRYRFNETLKVWESRSLNQNDWGLCPNGNMFFANPEFIPYDEPADTELLEAQKLVGQWVKHKHKGMIKKIREVKRDENGLIIFLVDGGLWDTLHCYEVTPVWVSEPRCCVDDPPEETGRYLVLRNTWAVAINHKYDAEDETWYDLEVRDKTKIEKGDVWFSLPQGGK